MLMRAEHAATEAAVVKVELTMTAPVVSTNLAIARRAGPRTTRAGASVAITSHMCYDVLEVADGLPTT
eukprot:7062216-Pyramimonas_sp.AAC.1